MNIHAFVFNWRGHGENAAALESELVQAGARTTVINSDETLAHTCTHDFAHWVHLGEDAYFAAQWNAALDRFEGDALLHVQADARPENVRRLVGRGAKLMREHPRIGVYEPQIDFTFLDYDERRLPPLGEDVREIPLTDTTCWLIAGALLADFPRPDPVWHRFGWGLASVVCARAALSGRMIARDFREHVAHPRARGYASSEAKAQKANYIATLAPDLRAAVEERYRLSRLCLRNRTAEEIATEGA